jgi:hypothetical protein
MLYARALYLRILDGIEWISGIERYQERNDPFLANLSRLPMENNYSLGIWEEFMVSLSFFQVPECSEIA